MTNIKVVSANFYVGNTQTQKDARFMRSLGFDVAGVQEGHSGNIEGIRAAIGGTHRVRFGDTFEGRDVPIVHRRTLKTLSFRSKQVSKRAEVKNIGMPRAASVYRCQIDGETFCIINTHLNAAVQSRTTGEPLSTKIARVYQYTRSIIALEAIIRYRKRKGEHVIVVGDLNFRAVPGGNDWFYSPHQMFKRLNMPYKAERIDYMAWTRTLRIENYRTIGTDQHGADHPWMVANFVVKTS